jgi:spore cortex biosynthesis protein YabQ
LTSILGQIETFILTLVLGLVTGTIFHFYQAIIRAARVSRYVLYALDFSLWIIIIVLVFLSMLFINQGEIRVYVLMALLIGILLYYRQFARRFDAAVTRLAEMTVMVCAHLYRGIKAALSRVKKLVRLKPRPKQPPQDPTE